MRGETLFFYDLETSGLNPREDRIMQFAGQRTDLDLNPIGEPVNQLIKITDDTLPNPGAIAVTGITPQDTLRDGIDEAEFARYAADKIFTPGTIALGYNTVRFDDEFMRHFFWRNFHDPYEWQWKDDRSRWDLLDVVRLTRALRPEGINWPVRDDGKPTNRLELITKLNGISHEHAHDALADVFASIEVAKLIRDKQPELYNYLFTHRDKKSVQKLINLDNKKPFVYASGRYGAEHNFTTVAFPLTAAKNGNILVADLRYDWQDFFNQPFDKIPFPAVKSFQYNRCPAVAPLGVLSKSDGWSKISLTSEIIEKNLSILLAHPEFAEAARADIESRPEFPPAIDAESALYDGFVSDHDKIRCNAVRNAGANDLADFHPDFEDERLPELLLHYKAKNYPSSLSESEAKSWQAYRQTRLERKAPAFLEELAKIATLPGKDFIAEELKLYFESLFDADY